MAAVARVAGVIGETTVDSVTTGGYMSEVSRPAAEASAGAYFARCPGSSVPERGTSGGGGVITLTNGGHVMCAIQRRTGANPQERDDQQGNGRRRAPIPGIARTPVARGRRGIVEMRSESTKREAAMAP